VIIVNTRSRDVQGTE